MFQPVNTKTLQERYNKKLSGPLFTVTIFDNVKNMKYKSMIPK
jgi:hypothetical protein